MSRNNSRRASGDSADSTASAAVATAPKTLSYVTPTEFVELPSRGKYYPTEHPLYNKEVVEIRYMTAKDEDILTSQSLLRTGLALERLLQNILVNKEIKVSELLVGDRNAILVAARSSGYGHLYETKVTCPACGEQCDHAFDLSDLPLNEGISPGDDSGVSTTSNGTFVATLPKTSYEAEFRLLNGSDETYLTKAAEKKTKLNLPDSRATDLLKRLIVSIEGVESRSEIDNFVDQMPAQDARFLRACLQVVTPNVDLKQLFTCNHCGNVTALEVPFTADFFWPQ